MKKCILLVLVLLAATLMAAPANYSILKVPAASISPTTDGTMLEWNEGYLVDSLTNVNNFYCVDDSINTAGFSRNRFQMYVYACHDDINVYYAVKIVADNLVLTGGCTAGGASCTYAFDNIKVNPGGQAAAFYVWSNGNIQRNPSNPYVMGTDMNAGANATGNNGLPTYEFFISKAQLDQFGLGTWSISVGSEDNIRLMCAVGAEFTGNKTACANSWDNPLYYPTWILSTDEGPTMGVENKTSRLSAERLSASPNPFMPSTVISCNVKNNGMLKIYDVNGKVVNSFSTKAGANNVQWNGTDVNGKNLSSGIYIARLVSGKNVLDQRLFLTR